MSASFKNIIPKSILSFLCLISCFSYSQDAAFDSLRALLNRKDDSVKMKALTNLAYRFEEFDNDSALVYMNKAIAVAKQIKRTDRELSLTVSKAEIFNLTGQFDSSRKYIAWVADRVSDTVYPKVKGYMLMTLADVYSQEGAYDSAISKLFAAQHIYETLNDSMRRAQVYGLIGRNYSVFGDRIKSSQAYYKSLEIAEALGNARMLSEICIYIGTDFLSLKKYDSAAFYMKKAERLSKENPDIESRLIAIYGNLGDIESSNNQSAKAIAYFTASIAISEKFEMRSLIPVQEASIAREYLKSKNYKQALFFLEKAEASLADASDVKTSELVYQTFAKYHFLTGNLEKGEAYLNRYSTLLDSSLNTSKSAAIGEMEVKYETAKKDKELLKQKLDIAEKDKSIVQQETALYILIAFFLFAAAASVLLYNRYRLRQQAKLDAAIIKEQRLAIKAVIEAQDAERERLSKDLHDGVLQQLVAAKAGLSYLQTKTDMPAEIKHANLQKISSLMDDTAGDLRNISHLMMPPALKDEGLAAAIKKLADNIFYAAGISCQYVYHGITIRPAMQTEIQLYRITQEIFTNIIKHAKASNVLISIKADNNKLLLQIEDNGIGFDETTAREKGGAGLFNILSRTRHINAQLAIEQVQQGGSRFILECPLGV